MLTTKPSTQFDLDDKAKTLSEIVRESDLTADEVLAFLAFATHGRTQPLVAAREAGADIGAIGRCAYMLKNRIEEEIA